MNLIFSVLSTFGTLVLVVATFVGFEIMVQPSSIQRNQVANVVWGIAGCLVIAIWVWYFAAKDKAAAKSKAEAKGKGKSKRS
ncbi:MAG: hypothetical protein JWM11_300 [Planctomycetaceae bacterium]|nr:hypothetical protein [Planctomycetaceae bacterium]